MLAHDTPFNLKYHAPDGLGIGKIDQLDPFQRSANRCS
jgi:hypothetical protein